jgi:hypothetical protein
MNKDTHPQPTVTSSQTMTTTSPEVHGLSPEEVAFRELLGNTKRLLKASGQKSITCFISYGWEQLSTPEGKAANQQLQAGLLRLVLHLRKVGVNTFFDIQRMSGNMEACMTDNLTTSDYIFLIGTEGFKQRVEDSSTNVHFEYQLALQKGHSNPHALQPLLFTGDFATSFPTEITKNLIRDFRDPSHYYNLVVGLINPVGLIPTLYPQLQDNKEYAGLVKGFEHALARFQQERELVQLRAASTTTPQANPPLPENPPTVGQPSSSTRPQINVAAYQNITAKKNAKIQLGSVVVAGAQVNTSNRQLSQRETKAISTLLQPAAAADLNIKGFGHLTLDDSVQFKTGDLKVTGVDWQHTTQTFFKSEKKALPPSATDKQLLAKITQTIGSLYGQEAFQLFQEQTDTYLQPFRERLLKPNEKQQLTTYLLNQQLLCEAKQLIEALYPDAEDEETRLQTLQELYQSFSKPNLTAEERVALQEYITTYQCMLPSEETTSVQPH